MWRCERSLLALHSNHTFATLSPTSHSRRFHIPSGDTWEFRTSRVRIRTLTLLEEPAPTRIVLGVTPVVGRADDGAIRGSCYGAPELGAARCAALCERALEAVQWRVCQPITVRNKSKRVPFGQPAQRRRRNPFHSLPLSIGRTVHRVDVRGASGGRLARCTYNHDRFRIATRDCDCRSEVAIGGRFGWKELLYKVPRTARTQTVHVDRCAADENAEGIKGLVWEWFSKGDGKQR